ncbi:hypothetical protein HYFRA_00002709 [Hymenoscyphus fraxineus]|uniref:Uncharacterized protein n=1 Tax=Hymenoscyphus fraxineus TaxID=746836 RepID=A0A9N9L6P8_9HELO|nr:hypothetical protein HYFRA_00002709 [Hymenoscyphus fraxineus]
MDSGGGGAGSSEPSEPPKPRIAMPPIPWQVRRAHLERLKAQNAPKKITRKFSQVVTRSADGPQEPAPDYLHANPSVQPQAKRRLEVMAKYLGLESKAAVQKWMESREWRPHWQEYYEASLNPRLVRNADPHFQGTKYAGPKFSEIQREVARGEAYGRCKYSNFNIDKTGWGDLQHAAFALYRMTKVNMDTRNGIFYGKKMKVEDVQVRVWLPVPREVAKASTALKNRDQPGSLKYLLPHQVPGKLEQMPVQEMTDEGQGGSPASPTAELDEDIQGLSDASSEDRPAKKRKLTHVN